jgi:hypothetical protein
MPKGFHYGRAQTRAYTTDYYRIPAKLFKSLINSPLGNYSINSTQLSDEHTQFKLIETKNLTRIVLFTIKGQQHQISLIFDDRSASKKLYITCPYCQRQRQHLYATKDGYSCRECTGLHYPCQSERPRYRLIRRIRKLRKDLWGYDYPEVNNMFKIVHYWPKPKGMRWNMFEQKRNKITELENRYWPMSVAQMRTMFGEQFNTGYSI